MIRFLPVLILATLGCARPEPYRGYKIPALGTADERELELRENLRDDRSWEEQRQMMSDVRAMFGGPADTDVTGPRPNRGAGAP